MRHLSKLLGSIAAATLLAVTAAQASGETSGSGESNESVLLTEQEQQRYERRMRQVLGEWRERVETLGRQGSEAARQATEAGRKELNAVWDDVEDDWRKLRKASGKAWSESRETFEQSMDALERRWEKLSS